MYSILIVDDEDNIRRAFRKAIDWNSIGFEIIGEASNGIEALDFIENQDVDLLISDIKMPIMTGIELAREARELKPHMQIVFLSGYDEFEFTKQAIRYNVMAYILKPITGEQILEEFTQIKEKFDQKVSEILDIDTQLDVLKELQDVKKDLFLSKLITGAVTKWQVEEYFTNVNMAIPKEAIENNYYVTCVTKYKGEDRTDGVFHKRLLNIVRIISQKYVSCECFLYGDRVVTVAYGMESNLDKYLSILPKDIVLTAKRHMNCEVDYAQSDYYGDFMQTHIAFLEANNAVISINKSDEQIVHIKDVVSKGEDIGIQELLHDLEADIIAGDKEAVQQGILGIFSCLQEKRVSGEEFNTYVLEILSVLFKVRKMISDDSEIKSVIAKFITFNATKEKIQEEIVDLGDSVVAGIVNQRQKNVGFLVKEATHIITTEFESPDINLSVLAERLHCSPNYLSSIIKKTLGKSFVELLVEARMKKAKEMLLTTNKKIREISEECGFANQYYFSYSFKKYFNQSPNAIRKKNAELV